MSPQMASYLSPLTMPTLKTQPEPPKPRSTPPPTPTPTPLLTPLPLRARIIPTPRNIPARNIFRDNGFAEVEPGLWLFAS